MMIGACSADTLTLTALFVALRSGTEHKYTLNILIVAGVFVETQVF